MRRGIQRVLGLILTAMVSIFLGGTADAFWGFGGSEEPNQSGLNLAQGYDRNTVVTINGTVAAPPHRLAGELLVFDLSLSGEQMVVVLGPACFLEEELLDWKTGAAVTIRGSIAQGKDGRTYLLSERIITRDGASLLLRKEDGTPAWVMGLHNKERGKAQGAQGFCGSGDAAKMK